MSERYRRACEVSAPVKLGLVSNPLAKTNWRSVAHERLRTLMPDPDLAISTPSIEQVPEAVAELLLTRGCNVLAINGGDGTIHTLVEATLGVLRERSPSLPTPLFLLLNGGGMNMLARTFDTRGHPVKTVRRFLDHTERVPLGALTTRHVPMLEVHEPDGVVRHGFIFGSELVLNALTMYERFGQGYRGLMRLFGAVGAGVLFETELWSRFGHLLEPPRTPMALDGVERSSYGCAVASTVPLTLMLGLIRSMNRRARPGRMEGFVITETDANRLVSMIPALLTGREHPAVAPVTDAREMTLYGPYTLDGERFIHLDADAPIRVRGSQEVFKAVWLG